MIAGIGIECHCYEALQTPSYAKYDQSLTPGKYGEMLTLSEQVLHPQKGLYHRNLIRHYAKSNVPGVLFPDINIWRSVKI